MERMKNYIYLCILFVNSLFSQSGSLDLTFNTNDVGYNVGKGPDDRITKTVVQPDGKIIIIGFFTTVDGVAVNHIARLNPDCSLDTSFNTGVGCYPSNNFSIKTVDIQSDGKIIVAGSFSSFNNVPTNNIVRLFPDGSVDTSFVNIFSIDQTIQTIKVQSDNKILISGDFTSFFGNLRIKVARLLEDGNLDLVFNTSNGISNYVYAFLEQADGKILIGGNFSAVQGVWRSGIARFNQDGTNDTTFNPGSGTNTRSVYDIVLQSDGKFIICGDFTQYNGAPRSGYARINPNGTLDYSFTNIGINEYPYNYYYSVQDIEFLNNDKIVIAGNFLKGANPNIKNIMCLNLDGSISSVGFEQSGTTSAIYSMAKQSDGKLLVAGDFLGIHHYGNTRILRFNENASVDTTFGFAGTSTNEEVHAICAQPDGKILVGGNFTRYNGISSFKLTRLNSDGNFDTTFSGWQGLTNTQFDSTIYSIKVLDDGKILIGGSFQYVNGILTNSIARLNSDGSLDTTFYTPYAGTANTMCIQNDGKIVVGGGLVRLNPDGSYDTSFPYIFINGNTHDIQIDANGKIVIAGSFSYVGNYQYAKIARLNPDGTNDLSFSPNNTMPNARINKFILLPNGKIFIAGSFTNYNNNTAVGMAILNSDGSFDSSFNAGTGIGAGPYINSVNDVFLQPNGRIVIAGTFTNYNGFFQNGIVRIFQDGSVDPTFNTNMGVGLNSNGIINSCELMSDGRIMIGGLFYTYNGTGRNNIARLNGSDTLENQNFTAQNITVFPNPFNDKIHIDNYNPTINKYELFDLLGNLIQNGTLESDTVSIGNLSKGIYLIKFYNDDQSIIVKKVIKE